MKKFVSLILIFAAVVITSCEGPMGPPGYDGVDGDSNFQVLVFAQGKNVLFDGISGVALVEPVSDIPFNLDAHLSDVGHWLVRSSYDQLKGFLQVLLAMGRHANLLERVNSSYFEVEAWVLLNRIAQLGNVAIDPIGPVDFAKITNSLNGHCSDG